MIIKLHKVKNRRELSHFVKFQRKLYKGNPYYVPPVDRGEIAFFDKSNPMVQGCEYELWLAYHNNHVVGRIAAIINNTYNSEQDKKQARFTHFDFIHNEHVAHLLLQEAQNWVKSKGMTEIIGPFGFTNLDKHGLLVEGFDELACQSSNYNHPYYQE